MEIFSKAKFICAPDDFLKSYCDKEYPKLPDIENAKWIWPAAAVRGHILRKFEIDGTVKTARADFVADTLFDFYINGVNVDPVKENNTYVLKCDVTKHVVSGINHIAIRFYQSGSPEFFSTAMIGGVTVDTDKGSYEFPTNEEYTAWLTCNFGQSLEPENWTTSDELRAKINLYASALHPRYLRRACIFKKSFDVKRGLCGAKLRAAANGIYLLSVNGKRFGNELFLPGSMEKYNEYYTFDLDNALTVGENDISFTLGNGWLNSESWGWFYNNKPALMAELVLTYSDGSEEIISTDKDFDVCLSPLVDNDVQFGERYDARLEDLVFSDDNYVKADIAECAKKEIIEHNYPPVREKAATKAQNMRILNDGVYIYDFGTNSTGRCTVKLKNTQRGELVKIHYAECLIDRHNPAIGVYQDVYFHADNDPGAPAQYTIRNLDTYICKGAAEEVFEPRFTFTGFRYIYIEGYTGEYTYDTVMKREFNTDLEEVGFIKTSYKDLNTMWDMITRSYRSNIVTGPLDCPTREKNFWNGDIQFFIRTACWYMDNSKFLARWTDGGRKMEPNIYGWEDEEYILPYQLFRYYGDKEVVKKKYPVVKALMAKRKSWLADGELIPSTNYCAPYRDHQAIENVPGDFFAAAYYVYMYDCAAKMADILGEEQDKKEYRLAYEKMKAEFNKRYYIPEEHDYTPRCQSGIVLPILLDIADETEIKALVDTLHSYVVKADYHFTTGFATSGMMLSLLFDYGYTEDAYKVLTARTHPSILHMADTGATTVTEGWKGQVPEYGRGASMNHYTFGSFSFCFFEALGGIKIKEPGFDEITLKPTFVKEIGDFSVSFRSRHGVIASSWKYDGDNVVWSFTIPKGVTATVMLDNGKKYGEGTYTLTF